MKKLILFLFLGIFLFGLNNLFADDFNDCLDKEVKTAREAGVDDPVSEAKRICDIKSPKDGNVAESKKNLLKNHLLIRFLMNSPLLQSTFSLERKILKV